MEAKIEKVTSFKDFSSTSKREAKIYELDKGSLPKVINGKIEVKFNYHSFIIALSINLLISKGILKASKEEIMALAISKKDSLEKDENGEVIKLDLYKKESRSNPTYIFNWWLGSLKELGYIK